MIWILQLLLLFGDGSVSTVDLQTEYETARDCDRANTAVVGWLATLPAPDSAEGARYRHVKGLTVQCVAWQKIGV